MKIARGLKIIDLALYLEDQKTLVIADTHIGYEEALNKQGVLVPRLRAGELKKRLITILDGLNLKDIVIAGDVKHEFGTISETEWRETIELLDFLSNYAKITLIKGNHDTILGPIAAKKNIEVVDYLILGDVLILHGHKSLMCFRDNKIKTIIIGHEHPAVSLGDGLRSERYKCFLKGFWNEKQVVVLPSFNLLTEGEDLTKTDIKNPLLKDINNFDVFIVADKVYQFGKFRNLLRKY